MSGPNSLLVIGDVLLDVDADGTSERLCPDAPVPVVDVAERRYRPGGAGLAALLAARDGVHVRLITALGRDAEAEILRELLVGVDLTELPSCGSTVVKTRVRLSGAPVLRLDHGSSRVATGELSPAVDEAIRTAGAVLVSDYGRGLTSHPEIRAALRRRTPDRPLVWDPHPRGAEPVDGCTVVTPNQAEAQRVLPELDEQLRPAELRRRWRAGAVALTRGAHGVLLAHAEGRTAAHAVPPELWVPDGSGDVCGAGDRFAVSLTERLRHGSGVENAVSQAVADAARFVAVGGAGECARARPERSVDEDGCGVDTLIEQTRRRGGRIVATGGCFDLLHRGHVTLLERARALGDLLVVCLNSDDSVRRSKGHDRPLVREADRARVLSSLSAVDAVIIFDQDTPTQLLERLRPDVWVKGDDYRGRPLPEAEVITRHGGRIHLVPLVDGHSTSRLVAAARPRVSS